MTNNNQFQQTKTGMKEQTPTYRTPRPLQQQRLLLLCDGAGTIVFAHGDANLLNRKLDDLRQRHFFDLGFSQYSLQKMNSQAEGGLLEPPRSRKLFRLQLVRPSPQKIGPYQYYENQELFLTELDIRCSLTRVRFGEPPIGYFPCKVVKESMNLLNTVRGQYFLSLLEVTRAERHCSFKTTYEDYCFSCEELEKSTEDGKIQEKP